MRRLKDYLVPLQRFLLGGLTPELASALSARASWVRSRERPISRCLFPRFGHGVIAIGNQRGRYELA